MLIFPESSSPVLVMISTKTLSTCNRFYAKRANSGKITSFNAVYPSLTPSFEKVGLLSFNGTQFCHQKLMFCGSPQWRFRLILSALSNASKWR